MNSSTSLNSDFNDVQTLNVSESEATLNHKNHDIIGNTEELEERSVLKEETISNPITVADGHTISSVSEAVIVSNCNRNCEESTSHTNTIECSNEDDVKKDPDESILLQSETPKDNIDVPQVSPNNDALNILTPSCEVKTDDINDVKCVNVIENASVESYEDDTISTKSDSSEDITPSSSDSSRKCFNDRNARHRGTVVYQNTSDDEFMGQYEGSASILNHPVYKSMVQELASSKEQIRMCHAEIDRLETENQRLEAENSPQIYVVQLEALEKTIGQQQKEIQMLLEQKKHLEESSAKSYNKLKQDLETKLQQMTKMYEGANREKEAMVVRYATSERDVIEGKKEREVLEKKVREAAKEREILLNRVKAMNGEKARICLILDKKSEVNIKAASKIICDELEKEIGDFLH